MSFPSEYNESRATITGPVAEKLTALGFAVEIFKHQGFPYALRAKRGVADVVVGPADVDHKNGFETETVIAIERNGYGTQRRTFVRPGAYNRYAEGTKVPYNADDVVKAVLAKERTAIEEAKRDERDRIAMEKYDAERRAQAAVAAAAAAKAKALADAAPDLLAALIAALPVLESFDAQAMAALPQLAQARAAIAKAQA